MRKLSPIHTELVYDGKTNSATYFVTPDYLAIGSDDDYLLTPITPTTAQKIADLLHCSLPTRKMVNDIHSAAEVKLTPSPIPPSAAMATVPIFIQHNATVLAQRKEQLAGHPLGALVAGHKKDVIISNRLAEKAGRVAIYGWHKPDGKAIQPLTIVHKDTWADYSHGIRLVQLSMIVNGATHTFPKFSRILPCAGLLSDEGPVTNSKYPVAIQSIVSPLPAVGNETNRHDAQFRCIGFGRSFARLQNLKS